MFVSLICFLLDSSSQNLHREICTIASGATALLRVQHSSYRKFSTSRSASVSAAYHRYVPSRRTFTSPTCLSFSKWCESVEAGIPISSCTSPTTIPAGCAASSKRKICKRGSAPSAEKRCALRVTKAGSGFLIFRLLRKYGRKASSFYSPNSAERSLFSTHPIPDTRRPWKPRQFAFDRVWVAWDNFCFRGADETLPMHLIRTICLCQRACRASTGTN